MKNQKLVLFIFSIVSVLMLPCQPFVFSDDMPSMGNQDNMEGVDRGIERVGQKKDALTAWGEYFFGKKVDPLDAQSMEEYQQGKEERDKRVQAGADFTQAATSVVTTLAPSPTMGSQVGTMVVGEATSAVVDAGSTAPPDNPNVVQRFFRWVASWFK